MADANLNENLNIVSESGLDIQLLDGDLNIIQKLDDEPNDVGGMTSAELKATFDKAGNIIKDYLNNQLVPAILAADATEAARAEAEAARQSAETGRVSAEEARASAEETRQSNETARKNAETSREDAETGRSSAEGQRASAEASRVTAETGRVTAEQEREDKESSRQTAELWRLEAESERVAAEEGRASAEAARSVWEDYSADKAYVPGNKVAYEGSSYLNISACAGIEPTNTDYWLLIARKGDPGTGDGGGDYLPTSGGSLYGALYFRAEGQTLVAAKLQGDYAAVNDNSEDDSDWGELPDDRQMLRLSKLLYIACTAGECGLNLNGGRICKVGDPTYTMDVANKRYVDGQKYTLPIAGSGQLGGVQPAAKTDAMTQAVGVDNAGALWTAPGGGSVDVDATLTQSGKAADAAAVGDALSSLSEEIANLGGGTGGCYLTVETITIGEGTGETVAVTGITLDYSTISLNEGESMMLAASVAPSDATNSTVLWKSSDTSVATVDNGLVTAVSSGNATITAYSQENSSIEATCAVTVAATSGGDTPGKIMFADMTPVKTGVVLNKNATTEYTNSLAHGYYKLPYSDGMQISTVTHPNWVANYPPVIVVDSVVTIPEYTDNGYGSGSGKVYSTTLSGFSDMAEVYANVSFLGGDDMNLYCYYIPGGAE